MAARRLKGADTVIVLQRDRRGMCQDERRAKQVFAAATAIAGQVEAMVSALRWRARAATAAVVLLALFVGAGAGWWWHSPPSEMACG